MPGDVKARARAKLWAIFLIDRRQLGQPIRAMSRRGLARRTLLAAHVRTFDTKGEAKHWLMEAVVKDPRFKYVIETI